MDNRKSGTIGLAGWMVIALIGTLWILPESSHASPVPVEEQTSRSFMSSFRSGINRLGAELRTGVSSAQEMVVNSYNFSMRKIRQGAAALTERLSEEKTEGPPVVVDARKENRTDDQNQFIFPDSESSEGVAFAEESHQTDSKTGSASTSTVRSTTTNPTTTTTSKDGLTKAPPATGSEPISPSSIVDEPTTDGLSLDDRSLFDVPEKSKCNGENQRTAKDGSCRTAIKQ